MGEAVLGAFLPVLLDKLADQDIIEYFGRLKGVNKNVLKNWWTTLTAIEAVLSDAEEKQLTERAVKLWLDDLRDLAYDIQDILDMFDTKVLEQKIKRQQEGSASKSWSSRFSKLQFNFSLNSEIKKVTGRLEEISKQEKTFGLKKLGVSAKPWKMPQTTCEPDGPVIGRDEAMAHIFDKLLSEEEQVVAIVGMPGVGKTTLAKNVFKEVATEQFNPKGWVCVSDDFDLLRVTSAVLESVTTCDVKESKELNSIQQKLIKELHGKKFLIVLDDVWNTCNYDQWTTLQSAFRVGAPGSKIIVTTRDVKVAMMLGDIKPHSLESMSRDDCWKIFEHHALLNNRHQDVEEVLKEKVVVKCNGLPLAARTIGGLLRSKRLDEWEEILDHKLWKLADEAGIIPALKLSYHYLPSNLKRCFTYCAILPNDYEFKEMELVLLWMAEGLIPQQAEEKKEMEDLGRGYFEELVSRSLFQKSSKGNSGYIMHDIVTDLARWAAGSSCCRLEDMQKIDSSQPRCLPKVRHSSFIPGLYDPVAKFEVYSEATCLRTFLPISPSLWKSMAQKVTFDLLPKFQYLRQLSLSGYEITELPDTIGELKHLRYLDLSHTLITSLPDSTTTLYNLQTLILNCCRKLNALPTNMKNLVNLRHLNISYTDSLGEMPPHLGELINLQTLTKFVIGQGSGSGVSEIGKLKHLQGTLHISRLENVISEGDARSANLKSKDKLEALLLAWSFSSTVSTEDAEVVLGMLQPHTKIKELTIEGYAGLKFPTWMEDPSFCHMVSIRLGGCNHCQLLPPFGQLPCLKQLYIQGMDAVESVGLEFYGQGNLPFQVLEILEFRNMKNWREWSPCQQSEGLFSCLKKLSIKGCPELEGSLPEKLDSLAQLEIQGCEKLVVSVSNYKQLLESHIRVCKMVVYDTSTVQFDFLKKLRFSNISELRFATEAFMKSLKNVKRLKITGCEKLTCSFEDRFLQHLISLDRLCIEDNSGLVEKIGKEAEQLLQLQILDYCKHEYLDLSNCASLVKVPEGLHLLTTLQELHLYKCSSLVSFPDAGLPPCLQVIHIQKCDSLLHFAKYQIPPSLKTIKIKGCSKLKSLIEKEEEVVLDASCSSYSLEYMRIWECPSLLCLLSKSQLPRSLKKLKISCCRELELISENVPEGMCHLTNLQSLSIYWCESLVSLPEQMCHLTNLQSLTITCCKSLVSLPEGMCHLTNLQSLSIEDCGSLVSLPRLGVWPRRVFIVGCEKLDVAELLRDMPMHSTNNVEELEIDYCEGLSTCSFPPNLTSLTVFQIRNCKALMAGLRRLTSLRVLNLVGKGDDTSLVSFPPGEKGMDILLPTSLVDLEITNFPNLKKLSKAFQFLTSLQSLEISECPKLEGKCRGRYRPNIAHIPCIGINNELI